MDWLVSIILGAVQGLTEFIPVSSSGHVIIAEHYLHGAGNHLFLEWINIGTVLALIIFFRKTIWRILQDIFVNKNFRLARNIILTSIPAGLIGFTFASLIESNSFFTSITTVVVTLALVGIVMIVLEKLPRLSEVKSASGLSWKRALGIGVFQVFALVPGVSRSGSTIIAGRLAGLSRPQAAEYSFLVSIPIMLGVIAKLLLRSSDRAYLIDNWSALLVANVVAFITGLVAVGFLLKYLKNNSLAAFGWYRVALAVVVLALILVQ